PHLFLRGGPLPPLRSGQVFLTKPNTSCTIEMPASLRSENCSPSARNAVAFPSESVFAFVGIRISTYGGSGAEVSVAGRQGFLPVPSLNSITFRRLAYKPQRPGSVPRVYSVCA